MATLPVLFTTINGVGGKYDGASAVTDWLKSASEWLAQHVGSPERTPQDRLMMMAALLSVPSLVAAALVRSMIVRNARPAALTLLAGGLGIVSIPVIGWLAGAGALAVRFSIWLAGAIRALVETLAPVLAVVIVAAVAVALLLALIALLKTEGGPQLAGVAIVVVVVVAGILWALGLIGLFAWLGDVIAAVERFLVRYVAPAIGWIVQVFLLLMAILIAVGLTGGATGQIGRTVYLPIVSAPAAGRDQGKCIDLAAGVGVSLSLLLCAAVLNRGFGHWMADVWRATPLVGRSPDPISAYDLILPAPTERFLAPAFENYSPTLGLGILLLVSALGVLGLLFNARTWENESGSRILFPVMIGVGVAVAMALPLLLITLWLNSQQE
ncbi:hypothetical protein [Actinomadura craniellae]|nr:hypothetical protein [Actinomadura craniellae]